MHIERLAPQENFIEMYACESNHPSTGWIRIIVMAMSQKKTRKRSGRKAEENKLTFAHLNIRPESVT